MSRLRRTWLSVVLATYAAYLYVFMEWAYFVTKPSFMDSFELAATVGSWLLLALAIWIFVAPAALIVAQLDGLLPGRAVLLKAYLLVPSLVLGTLFLLMADNLIYTFTRWGIVRTGFITRWLWVLLFGYLLYRAYRLLNEHVAPWLQTRRAWPQTLLAAGLVAASAIYGLLQRELTETANAEVSVEFAHEPLKKPNIIFLATDGVEARYLSAYGFRLPTSPFLETLADESMVFDNAFSNCGKTTGSTTAMFTGKLPTQVKVGFPPQVLPREYGYQHLPAMLRRLGYTGFQRTVRWYADAGDLNMVGSFDEANYRPLWIPDVDAGEHHLSYVFNSELMFAARITERLQRRLLHIFGIKKMVNHFILVAENEGLSFAEDRDTVEHAKAFIKSRSGPFFMHLHLMGTHCCRYRGTPPHFQPDQLPEVEDGKKRRRQARMLSSIRESDSITEEFVGWLRQEGLLDNTILVISSDHTQRWDTVQRIPLVVRFPNAEHTGRVSRNVELVDLPATLLDYIGAQVPEWMISRSLLGDPEQRQPRRVLEPLGEHEPILSLATFRYKRFHIGGGVLSRMSHPGPPLYGVKKAAAVVCNRWYKLNTETGEAESGEVGGHTAPCPPDSLPSDEEAAAWLRTSLTAQGFELPD